MTAPIDELTEPTSHDPVPDLVENIIGSTQYISPSYWIGQAIALTGIPNPWQWVADQYGGDWAAVQSAGIALHNLGDFGTSCATVVSTGAEAAQADWDGNAADAADRYFAGLAATIREQAPDLRSMGREFEQLAAGMYEAANAIKGLLEFLTDLLLAIGLEAAAAAASSWTVVGPVLAGAAALATIAKAMGVWGDILEVHGHVWTAVQGFTGVVAGYLSALQDLEQHALPAAYDHPAV